MNVFDLEAVLRLNKEGFESGLNAAKKAIGLAGAAIGAASAAVTAFGAASVKTGSEFDKAMAQVAATSGKTVDEITDLRDFAQQMGSTTAFSATQAAEALNFMALAGYDAETSMAMLPNVLDLAASGAMDLATASDMITDTQTAFGISLERTSQMVDEMAKAASTGNTSVSQLGEAFLTVGGLAAELNGGMITLADGTQTEIDGVQELEIAFTAMANAGVKGSEAGTHMRNMLLKLSSPSKEGAEALDELGVAVFDDAGKMRSLKDIMGDLDGAMSDLTQEKKIKAISDIFNARDVASAEALLNAVGQDWDAIGASILEADGAAKQMAKTQLDNLAGKVTLFQSALEGFQIAISDKLTPALEEFVSFGSDGLSRLTSAFKTKGLNGAMEELGTILSDGIFMIIDKLPAMLDAGGKLIGALVSGVLDNAGNIVDAAADIITMFLESMVSATNGGESQIYRILTIIVDKLSDPAFIVHFINLGVSLIENILNGLSDPDAIRHLVLAAGTIVEQLIRGFSDLFPTILSTGTEIITSLVQGLTMELPYLIPVLLDAFLNIITSLADSDLIPSLIKGAIDIVVEIVKHLPEIVMALIKAIPKIIEMIIKAWFTIVEEFGKVFGLALDAIKKVFANVGDWFKEKFGKAKEKAAEAWSGIKDKMSQNWENTKAVFAKIGDWAKEKWENAKEKAAESWGKLTGKMDEARKKQEEVYAKLSEWALNKWEDAKEKASTAWANMKEKAAETWQNIQDVNAKVDEWFRDKWEDAKEKASKAWANMKEKAAETWKAVQEANSKVDQWFGEKWTKAKEKASKAWGLMKEASETTWKQIKNVFSTTVDFYKNLFTNAKNAVVNVWSNIKEKFGDIWGRIKEGFSISDALNWGKDMIQNFIDGISQMWNNLKQKVSDVAGLISSFLHFSEPDQGELANFHTFAPDMMKLFIKGIKDNEKALQAAVVDAFSFKDVITGSLDGVNVGGNGGNVVNLNVYQPVQSPSDMARMLREEAQYGLFRGGAYA